MRFLLVVGSLTAVCTSGALAQVERHVHGASDAHDLGVVEFENSGAASAQEPFLRGLALLHSFEYDQAAESFREAQHADPDFAMAYWGEALTYAHLLWGEDDPESARGALKRLAPTAEARLAAAGTPRERAYGVAVEALFADTDQAARVRGFADAMQRVVAAYPDDLDAAAFGALSLMFTEYVGDLAPEQRVVARDRAITLAEHVFEGQPQHPGGTHYLIHATDDPRFASRGLPAARLYAEIAPAAQHALHMPSHIFLQLGMWRDVVASNERAWAASRAEVAARDLSPADLGFHSLQWLQYGYLQQGRYRAAKALVDTARAVLAGIVLNNGQHVDARFTVHELEFMHAVHSGQWDAAVCARAIQPAPMQPPRSERERSFQSIATYHRAIAAAMCDAEDSAVLEQARARVSAMAPDDPSLPMLRAAILHAAAVAAERRGDHSRVIELLTSAAAAPARAPVGPAYTLRVHELFGAALLKVGRAQEAVAAYERALQLTPGRSSALLGLARARAADGDRAAAADAYRALLDNWEHADADVAELDEVRRGTEARAAGLAGIAPDLRTLLSSATTTPSRHPCASRRSRTGSEEA
jgi:tetratricopeptide (TPR) repeat protein